MMKRTLLGFLAVLAFARAAYSQGIRCAEEVQAQLQQERAELHAILAEHFGGHTVDGRLYGLPQHDFDDASNITIRQRQWYRRLNPDLPERGSGPYQYPRWVFELMNRLDYAGALVCEDGLLYLPGYDHPLDPDAPIVLPNINVSNDATPESETYLAIDPTNQQYLVGASNINVNARGQMVYYSSDYGDTWGQVELIPTRTNHSDPGVNFTSNGTVYSCVVDYTSSLTQVKFYKSTDHGVSWPGQVLVDDANGNDKELATIDYQTDSSCKDQIYACWDDGNNQFVSSTTAPNSDVFRPKIPVQSGAFTIACDLAPGPPATTGAPAPVYNVWADTKNADKSINFSRSTDCGATWSAFGVVANTNDTYDYCIPAQDVRFVLIYPSIDVDRSNGPRRGWVYVAWNDLIANQTGGGCLVASDSNNANVYFSRSTDGGNTWSNPVIVNTDIPMTDQFNQWMRVDDADGTIHISWHDTRNDPNRVKTDIYYSRSTDGGFTFQPETLVTTEMTDETTAGSSPDQYGDYEGLAARNGLVYPFWTDRRVSSGTDEEIFTSRVCSEPKNVGVITATDLDPCSQSGIQISWTPPDTFWGDGGAGVRKYQLWIDGVLAVDNIPEGVLSTVYSPGDSASHSYNIRAVNSCDNFSDYTPASQTDVSGGCGADLAVTQSDSPDPVTAGNNLTYTVTITNNGPLGATGVTLSENLPIGVNFVSSTPGAPTCTETAGVVTCALGSLAAATNTVVVIDVLVDPATFGTITNEASAGANESDPNPANNANSENTLVNPPGCPLVTFVPSTLPGGSIGTSYSQTISASGGAAPYVFTVFAGALPPGLTLDSAGLLSGSPSSAGSFNFSIAATDANHCSGTQDYSVSISSCLFCDYFEDGVLDPNWTYLKPNWTENGGSLIGIPTGRKAITVASPVFSGCSICSVETIMETGGGSFNKLWLLAWYVDKKNTIELLMKEEANKWVLKQRINGTVVGKAKGLQNIDPNTFYKAVVVFDGTAFQVFIDGNATPLMTLQAAGTPSGTVGFQTKSTTGTFAEIVVN